MSKIHGSLAAGSMVWICCDRFEQNDCSGRFYTRYVKEPVRFRNAGELISRMEQFYDWLGYPQASVTGRSFQKQSRGKRAQQKTISVKENKRIREGEKTIMVNEKDMSIHQGEKATFLVRIQYRQNASWQGQVTWAEKNRTVPFRSALELLKLIDSTAALPEAEEWDKGAE